MCSFIQQRQNSVCTKPGPSQPCKAHSHLETEERHGQGDYFNWHEIFSMVETPEDKVAEGHQEPRKVVRRQRQKVLKKKTKKHCNVCHKRNCVLH